ncbi:hypothetical protein [Salipiger mangrovisoli]|uniref:Cytochrome c domain-containing protein n=1 Tax=Salipiger mangrovisoli TaxID=2865933 RepID=A0ABR9WYG0_9RHOB|nr:hypothetical protein [Salipiger mangrovisoli]MBE9636329.1 hypothetical protein [Salipiger mangrovisoli]
MPFLMRPHRLPPRSLPALRRVPLLALAVLAGTVAVDAETPVETWEASCARCHREPARLGDALPAPDDAVGMVRLDRFLAGHHLRDAEARAALVAWLAAQRRQ